MKNLYLVLIDISRNKISGNKMRKILAAGAILLSVALFAAAAQASDSYQKMHNEHHSGDGHHGHHSGEYQGHDHHGEGEAKKPQKHARHKHDMVNMPGLQGVDTTEVEISDLKTIFINHMKIKRTVENLPNGIKTMTETEDDDLRESIITHVAFMVTRLEEGRNPKVIIQSPTLDLLFDKYDEIETTIEMTDLGVEVIQASANREVVALLQQHAAEVSDMAARGMQAVHERMMQ